MLKSPFAKEDASSSSHPRSRKPHPHVGWGTETLQSVLGEHCRDSKSILSWDSIKVSRQSVKIAKRPGFARPFRMAREREIETERERERQREKETEREKKRKLVQGMLSTLVFVIAAALRFVLQELAVEQSPFTATVAQHKCTETRNSKPQTKSSQEAVVARGL